MSPDPAAETKKISATPDVHREHARELNLDFTRKRQTRLGVEYIDRDEAGPVEGVWPHQFPPPVLIEYVGLNAENEANVKYWATLTLDPRRSTGLRITGCDRELDIARARPPPRDLRLAPPSRAPDVRSAARAGAAKTRHCRCQANDLRYGRSG